jgi:hypothetical protein
MTRELTDTEARDHYRDETRRLRAALREILALPASRLVATGTFGYSPTYHEEPTLALEAKTIAKQALDGQR